MSFGDVRVVRHTPWPERVDTADASRVALAKSRPFDTTSGDAEAPKGTMTAEVGGERWRMWRGHELMTRTLPRLSRGHEVRRTPSCWSRRVGVVRGA